MKAVLALIALVLVLPASALGASSSTVIRDCTDDGQLQGRYTQKELAAAIAALPSDAKEYTDCSDVLSAAQRAGAGGSSTGSSSGSSGGTTGGTTGGGTTGGGATAATGAATGSATGTSTTATTAATATTTPTQTTPKSSTAGEFGGFNGYDRDPAKSAAAAERRDIDAIVNGRGPKDSGNGGLPVPIAIALVLLALALLALAGLEVRRRRVGPRRLTA